MKLFFKILMVFAVICALILAVLYFPYPKPTSKELENDILLRHYRIGGFRGFADTITFYKNGFVNHDFVTGRNSSTLPDWQLSELKDFIEQKKFRVLKTNLFKEWIERKYIIYDGGYFAEHVNYKGKTYVIGKDDFIDKLISDIYAKKYVETNKSSGNEKPQSSKYCDSANDCEPVGCYCGCSGCGGFAAADAVNKNHIQEWYTEHNCTKPNRCLDVCCSPRNIVCENNLCMIKEGEALQAPKKAVK